MAKQQKRDDIVTDPNAAAMITNPEAMPEFKDFVEEQIELPPYWNPEEGKWWYGMPITVDDADPEFVRYVVQAEKDIVCMRGKKNEQEEVLVKAGEFFTLSAYAGLPLHRYIGTRVLIRVKGTRDVGRPQEMWTFSLHVDPKDKAKLMEARRADAQDAIRRFRETRAGQNALPAKGETKQLSA